MAARPYASFILVAALPLIAVGAPPAPTPGFQPGYFSDLFGAHPNQRWPDTKKELLVFVTGDKNSAKIVLDGARSWGAALKGGPALRQVSSADIADIRVEFARDVLGDGGLGESQVTFEVRGDDPAVGDGILTGAKVVLRASMSEPLLRQTAAHEFGHVLGIVGRSASLPSHSPGKLDLMNAIVRARSKLTQRDINTMAWLYSLPRPAVRDLGRKRFTIRTRLTKSGCTTKQG